VSRVRPFRALRYDPARVDLARVLVPPYDVIAAGERAPLFERDPHSAIRLELTRRVEDEASTDYTEVGRTLEQWQRSGILVRDARPALYALRQTFTAPDGARAVREGFFGLLGLEDYARRVVRPHERTLAGPKADRLKLLRASRANLSSVFLLYEDPQGSLRAPLARALDAAPLAEARDASGIVQRLARIADPARIEAVRDFLSERPLVIADGHHRYETALAYRDEGGPEHVLAYLADMHDPGLVILPTHRLVRGALPVDAAALETRLGEAFAVGPRPPGTPRGPGEIDCILPDRQLRLRPLPPALARIEPLPAPLRSLDVTLFQRAILEPMLGLDTHGLDFTHDDAEAEAAVPGRASVAFLVNPPTIDAVRAVCLAGEVMPEKSTYFYPKLADGLVFDLFDPRWS